MRYIVEEVVSHYHIVETSEEVDMEQVITMAASNINRFDTGYEAIKDVLWRMADKCNIEYNVIPNYCGTKTVDMALYDEME